MSVSATEFAKSDEQLAADKKFQQSLAHFNAPAPKALVETAVKSLEAKKHTVKVVDSDKEAVAYLGGLLKDGVSLSMGASTTLQQIGFIDYLKTQDARINNLKGKAAAAAAAGNMAEHGALLHQGASADVFLSSVAAISAEDGAIIGVDLSGSRVNGWLASKHLVLVTGSNKVVKDLAEAEQRVQYQLALESARVRVAYKIPGSAVNNKLVINGGNPFGPRITVVIINQAWGF